MPYWQCMKTVKHAKQHSSTHEKTMENSTVLKKHSETQQNTLTHSKQLCGTFQNCTGHVRPIWRSLFLEVFVILKISCLRFPEGDNVSYSLFLKSILISASPCTFQLSLVRLFLSLTIQVCFLTKK